MRATSNRRASAARGVAREVDRRLVMKLMASVEQLRVGLDYHLARHNLLTANLAHVDTPTFKPLDLERRSSFDGALRVALEATDPNHLGARGAEQWKTIADPGASTGADGNGVNIDREAVKIASNQLRYDVVAQLASSELAGLAWAANDGRTG
jgi:flagellar basal-body rod protein FlgB